MKRASLLAAAAIVLVANMFALVHAWRNRSGSIETNITLTERELPLSYNLNEDDTGVSLDLRWLGLVRASFGWERPALWLDQKALQELGFDTSVAPSDDKAIEFYQRQRARRAFVALEYDGPAWRKHLEEAERQDQQRADLSHVNFPPHSREADTHLVAIDASIEPVHLRPAILIAIPSSLFRLSCALRQSRFLLPLAAAVEGGSIIRISSGDPAFNARPVAVQ